MYEDRVRTERNVGCRLVQAKRFFTERHLATN